MKNRLISVFLIVLLVMIVLKVRLLSSVSIYAVGRLTNNIKQLPLKLVESCIFETIKPYVMPTLNKYKVAI